MTPLMFTVAGICLLIVGIALITASHLDRRDRE